jgi:catechol 2,3-dioxygenase-like lactoylglutathione lyase family enzyme
MADTQTLPVSDVEDPLRGLGPAIHLDHWAMAHLATHGVPVELGPVARNGAAGAGLSVYFRDPDGSLLEFITYPEA